MLCVNTLKISLKKIVQIVVLEHSVQTSLISLEWNTNRLNEKLPFKLQTSAILTALRPPTSKSISFIYAAWARFPIWECLHRWIPIDWDKSGRSTYPSYHHCDRSRDICVHRILSMIITIWVAAYAYPIMYQENTTTVLNTTRMNETHKAGCST